MLDILAFWIGGSYWTPIFTVLFLIKLFMFYQPFFILECKWVIMWFPVLGKGPKSVVIQILHTLTFKEYWVCMYICLCSIITRSAMLLLVISLIALCVCSWGLGCACVLEDFLFLVHSRTGVRSIWSKCIACRQLKPVSGSDVSVYFQFSIHSYINCVASLLNICVFTQYCVVHTFLSLVFVCRIL